MKVKNRKKKKEPLQLWSKREGMKKRQKIKRLLKYCERER